MSKQFKFKCESCNQQAYGNYNGETWLPPFRWMQIYNPHLGEMLDVHLCQNCVPKIKKPKSSK